MSFLNLDDGFSEHPKIAALSHQAYRMHVTGLLYCSRNLTDGHVSSTGVRVVSASASVRPARYLAELETAGLWTPDLHADGYWIHDYLKHNSSASEIKQRRDHARKAARARWRDASSIAPGIAPGNAEGNALPSLPIPWELTQSPPSGRGHEKNWEEGGEPLEKLHRAVGGTAEALTKLRRTWATPTEAACIAALEACTGPGVHDRLAVAISELKKRRPPR